MAGFLHASEYGKNALVFDLIEEFRTPIVDTLCCTLFNHNVLSPELFRTVTSVEDSEADNIVNNGEETILLTNEGLKKVIPAFEKKMETLVYYPPLETQLSLDMIIIEQVKQQRLKETAGRDDFIAIVPLCERDWQKIEKYGLMNSNNCTGLNYEIL
jgi:CRISPR-associated protein Cas1